MNLFLSKNILLVALSIILCSNATFSQLTHKVESSLEIFEISTGKRTVVYKVQENFEAPNWSGDGKFLIFNSNGRIYQVPVKGGTPQMVNTGFANKCNNDHGISHNGKTLAISHHDSIDGKSRIYLMPVEGGVPKLVTKNAPSYWHGWSHNDSTLAYCAERNGNYDIYTIPVLGGQEKRLTVAAGLDDGPEYSSDGKYIFFNSVRTGKMKIWKMKKDGSHEEQLTNDSYNDWFPHPSPDGRFVVFITYISPIEAGAHPPYKEVMLRIMPMNGGTPKVLVKLFGGQGTINVPSWSPDSRYFAFVSYKYLD